MSTLNFPAKGDLYCGDNLPTTSQGHCSPKIEFTPTASQTFSHV